MDWDRVIERQGGALRLIVAALVAMAGLGEVSRGQFTFFPQRGCEDPGSAQAEKSKLSPALTLPGYLYRKVLRLLRPAESAARRLIIVVARDMVAPAPKLRARRPKPKTKTAFARGRFGTGIVRPRAVRGAKPAAAALKPLSFPLLDPLRRPFRAGRRGARGAYIPRISTPGFTARFPVAPPPSLSDPIDSTRLGLRLAALVSALDDLPAQARRFARWRGTAKPWRRRPKNSGTTASTRCAAAGPTAAAGQARAGAPTRSTRCWANCTISHGKPSRGGIRHDGTGMPATVCFLSAERPCG